jgi:hypothetical protein
MRTLALALLLSPSVTLACASAIPPPILDPPRVTAPPIMVPPVLVTRIEVAAADDDVREAVFRHLFDHNASGLQKTARVYCLQIEENHDPSPELLRRFDGSEPRVTNASRCTFEQSHTRSGVVDETGAPGLIFRVDTIVHPAENTAIVEGGYFEAGLSASGNVYELVRDGARWIVTKDTMKWIS